MYIISVFSDEIFKAFHIFHIILQKNAPHAREFLHAGHKQNHLIDPAESGCVISFV